MQLRDKDVFDLDQVAYAILEKDGQLSILKKTECGPITPKDMNIKTSVASIDFEVIYDESIVQDNLDMINRNEKWLMNKLTKKGIKDVAEVFLATYNASSGLHIDLYEDNIEGNNKNKIKE